VGERIKQFQIKWMSINTNSGRNYTDCDHARLAEVKVRVIFVESPCEIASQDVNRELIFSFEQSRGGKWRGIGFHCSGISRFMYNMSVTIKEYVSSFCSAYHSFYI
jgi:hypothetical protein